jgi:Popeye protein conserved region
MGDSWLSYLIYIVAYGASILAFSFKSIYLLRIFVAISSTFYVIYYYLFPAEPMWLDIISEAFLVFLNLGMLLYLSYSQSKVVFSDEEKELYKGIYNSLSTFEFFKLIKMSSWKDYDAEEQIIEKNTEVKDLFLIYNGEVHVVSDNDRKVKLQDGSFIGEISFNSGIKASADIYCQPMTRMVVWDQKRLKEFLNRNPNTSKHFNTIITQDLTKKLLG